MVEGRPEIVNNVPDDSAPFQDRWLLMGFNIDDYLTCLSVEFGLDFVRATIEERANLFVQGAQAHLRPIDLDQTATKVDRHSRTQRIE